MIDEHDVREMLQRRAGAAPAVPADTPKAVQRARRRLVLNGAIAMLAVVAIAGATLAGVDAIRSAPVPADTPAPDVPTPGPAVITEPGWFWRARGTSPVQATDVLVDPRDVDVPWLDVTRVEYDVDGQPYWTIQLAARPPRDRGPTQILSYGLVLETTGDGAADYEVGIEDSPSRPGDFRVWVTNLVTGETSDQDGPPYGVPIEFSHPDEGGNGSDNDQVHFTFLPGTEPDGINLHSVRFYAWSSLTSDGKVVARDEAPDTGWMVLPGPH